MTLLYVVKAHGGGEVSVELAGDVALEGAGRISRGVLPSARRRAASVRVRGQVRSRVTAMVWMVPVERSVAATSLFQPAAMRLRSV